MLPLILSIGNFVPGLFGKKLSDRLAKITGITILVIVTVAAVVLLKCAYDASVINQHEASDRAVKAEKQLDADRKADEATANRAAEADDLQRKLDAATSEAAKSDPVAAANKVGPVSQSYYDTLRKKKEKK